MAYDLQTIQARIADELARSDLTSQIATAINSAIKFWERERWPWNETVATWATIAATEYEGTNPPSDIVEIDEVKVTVSGKAYPATLRAFSLIDGWQTSDVTGPPTDFAYYKGQHRWYPIPDQAYTVTEAYVYRLATLVNPTDTNAWVDTAEELTRQRAKADVLINILRDPDAMQAQAALALSGRHFLSTMEMAAYTALRHETSRRLSSGRVRASRF